MPLITKMTARSRKHSRILRNRSTAAEKFLWRKLRDRRFHHYKFRRQVAIGPFIVDFLCVEERLVIEVDGDAHLLKRSHDQKREKWLQEQGFQILRFNNDQILKSIDFVLGQIASALPLIPTFSRGEKVARNQLRDMHATLSSGRGLG